MKRDIKVNFGTLESITSDLASYEEALNTVKESINSVNENIKSHSEGDAIEKLSSSKENLITAIDNQIDEISSLRNLIASYSSAMQSYIQPVSSNSMVRVDRNDIAANLWHMDFEYDQLMKLDSLSLFNMSVFTLDEDEKEKQKRNAVKLDAIADLNRDLRNKVLEYRKDLDAIHQNNVIPFENTDDDFKGQADELYKKVSTFKEKTSTFLSSSWKNITQFGKGFFTALGSTVQGIGSLIKTVVTYPVSGIVVLVTKPFDKTPKWADDIVKNVHNTIGAMVNDPFGVVEGMGQQLSDTWDKEGLAYASGSIAFEVVELILLKKLTKVSKVEAASDTSKIVDKLDDAADASKVVDNLGDFARGTKSFDEILDDFARAYADKVNSNKTWKWRDIEGSELLTQKQMKEIRDRAKELGSIPDVPMKSTGPYPDFEKANLIVEINGEKIIKTLPEELWKMSDKKQFEWLDSLLPDGKRPSGTTWHHSEIDGRMELVPYGIHNSINHKGGRAPGNWADGKR